MISLKLSEGISLFLFFLPKTKNMRHYTPRMKLLGLERRSWWWWRQEKNQRWDHERERRREHESQESDLISILLWSSCSRPLFLSSFSRVISLWLPSWFSCLISLFMMRTKRKRNLQLISLSITKYFSQQIRFVHVHEARKEGGFDCPSLTPVFLLLSSSSSSSWIHTQLSMDASWM